MIAYNMHEKKEKKKKKIIFSVNENVMHHF